MTGERMKKPVFMAVATAVLIAFSGGIAEAKKKPKQKNLPGVFDYYVLSMSWSPYHCALVAPHKPERNRDQCGAGHHFGFVLHGLWPQSETGTHPRACVKPPPTVLDGVAQEVKDITPSDWLIGHEWAMHGTCDGTPPQDYFEKAEKAFRSIAIPAAFRTPNTMMSMTGHDLELQLMTANPALGEDMIAVQEGTAKEGGRGFFKEVFVCLDRNLAPRRCGKGASDTVTARESVRVHPVP